MEMHEITLKVTTQQLDKLMKRAQREGKSLEQSIIDRIEEVPYGYTVYKGKIEIHEPQAEKIRNHYKYCAEASILKNE